MSLTSAAIVIAATLPLPYAYQLRRRAPAASGTLTDSGRWIPFSLVVRVANVVLTDLLAYHVIERAYGKRCTKLSWCNKREHIFRKPMMFDA